MNLRIPEHLNQSPISTCQNLIMSPSERKGNLRAEIKNLKGDASGRAKLFNINVHEQNLRQVGGQREMSVYGMEGHPNEQNMKARTSTSCMAGQSELICENYLKAPATAGLHDHAFGSFVSSSAGMPLSPLAPNGRGSA